MAKMMNDSRHAAVMLPMLNAAASTWRAARRKPGACVAAISGRRALSTLHMHTHIMMA
jgi:hypothetical protein